MKQNDREVIYSLFERHIRRIVPEGIRVAFDEDEFRFIKMYAAGVREI